MVGTHFARRFASLFGRRRFLHAAPSASGVSFDLTHEQKAFQETCASADLADAARARHGTMLASSAGRASLPRKR
jgi:hypothetical protein